MGAPATRITAADFHTPPELKEWRLAADPAGRIGGVRLELSADAAGTRLGACYQQVPLRVVPPFRFGLEQPALLYLLNPTAGLLDGDAQLVELSAGSGSRAVVVGQSATRIHPSIQGFATQQWHVRVATGAVLVVLPGPAIPFQGSRYYQRVMVDLAAGAHLVWGDVWVSGRYARGVHSERFRFETLVQELTIRREGRPVFRDRFCWRGPWDGATAAWHFGGAAACGSLFATGRMEERGLASAPTLGGACFLTAHGDTCCRWQGSSEEVVAAVVATAFHLASLRAGQLGGKAWLSPTHELAPNHWFSALGAETSGDSR